MFSHIICSQPTLPRPKVRLSPVRRPPIKTRALLSACGLVHDETATRVDTSGWITQRAYRQQHGVSPTELELTHTYCPKCFTQFEKSVQQFFRKTG